MTKGTQRKLLELGTGAVLYGYAIYATERWELVGLESLMFFLLAYIVLTASKLWDMVKNFKDKKFTVDENVLMLIATIGAFLVGKNAESDAVMLFFQCGKFMEQLALQRSRKSIEKLMDIRPDHANRKVNGKEVVVDPSELKLRHIIIIKPGERVPVDAIITSGRSTIDTQAITGESMPQEVEPGDVIYSGSINVTGVLEARVMKLYGESTVSKILNLVQNASSRKAKTENFVGKFTKFYTPIVTILALAIMIVPPFTFAKGDIHTWVYRGLIFLVTACPCGLLTSVPLAFFGGIGAASRQGVVIKGSNYLEALASADTFVFDKTGTLTKGVFRISKVHPVGMDEDELLELAALGEAYSTHPIAVSLRDAYGKVIDKKRVKWIKEFTGFGVRASVDDKRVFIGSAKFMKQNKIFFLPVKQAGTVVHVSVDTVYAGYILISDTIREEARHTIEGLKHYQQTAVMLTGDNERAANDVARRVGIEFVYANLLPEEKVEQIEEFMESQLEEEKLVFVGDGINDAPVLARADVGIAMGGLGSDAAIEAADVVLMEDDLSRIINAMKIARETMRVVKQNVTFAIGIKVALLILAVVGFVTMRVAIVADMVVLVINIMNSIWVVHYPE